MSEMEKGNYSDSPFGSDSQGAVNELKKEPPSREALTDERLGVFVDVVLRTLDGQVADRDMKPTGSPTSNVADRAHRAFVVQGIRLLVLERIILARGAKPLPRMAKWLAVIKVSAPVADALRKGGVMSP